MKTIGIVDFGVGNHSSVAYTLKSLGYNVRISNNKSVLNKTDLLLLPGVGAFSKAMEALNKANLSEYLQGQAIKNKPIIGLCLGMQLLMDLSFEGGKTDGLGLIPGSVVPFKKNNYWHIGWNSIYRNEELSHDYDEDFYFNHSFICKCPKRYIKYYSNDEQRFPAIIQSKNIIGIQFHPEKSQIPGKKLLVNIIESFKC
jgi:imidazole glycerol-phosphate synthase subunit HisH